MFVAAIFTSQFDFYLTTRNRLANEDDKSFVGWIWNAKRFGNREMMKVRILRLKDMNFEVITLHSIFFFIEIFQTFCSLPHNIMLHEFIFLPKKKKT